MLGGEGNTLVEQPLKTKNLLRKKNLLLERGFLSCSFAIKKLLKKGHAAIKFMGWEEGGGKASIAWPLKKKICCFSKVLKQTVVTLV